MTQPFTSPVTVCFSLSTPPANLSSTCFAFISDQGWTCQSEIQYDSQSNQYCGYTDHFTDFSLLLLGENPNNPGEEEETAQSNTSPEDENINDLFDKAEGSIPVSEFCGIR